jgi:hypothetical protein
MNRRRRLPLAPIAAPGLGLPTIMDRDLVSSYGAAYVRLAVFAIDVDRVYWLEPEDSALPFGWEVFLTEYYLLATLDRDAATAQPTAASEELLEALCLPLLDETPGEPPLGGQIVFAVYDAVARGALPTPLTALFHRWRNPPRELAAQLASLHTRSDEVAQQLAAHCLDAELSPPLAQPTRAALESICSGGLLQTSLRREP